MRTSRILCLLLVVCLLLALTTGCGSSQETVTETEATQGPIATESPAEPAPATETPAEPVPKETSSYFPITDESAEMSLWAALSNSMNGYFDSWGQLPVFQKYEEMTNVHINFVEVSAMEGNEAFNIMVASGEYTDMVLMLAGRYAGGASKALEEDVIISLEGYMETCAPDYLSLINSDEEMRRATYTDEGHILAMYGYYQNVHALDGYLIRQDWLDELGLEVPGTYEEIEVVAEAFKVNYGCSMPVLVDEKGLIGENGGFIGGYGTKGFLINSPPDIYSASEFYQKDGQLQCSFLDDGFRDFLAMMADWYSSGYFNSDWVSIMGFQDAWLPYILNNSCGIFPGSLSVIDYIYNNHADEGIKLSAMPQPKVNATDEGSHFANNKSKRHATASISVTTGCQDPELAIRWINGFFTDEGITLANWGVEGQSYEIGSDGQPHYTALITDDQTGASTDTLLHIYAIFSEWPTLNNDASYTLYDEESLAILDFWTQSGDGAWLLPRGTALTTAESAEFSTLAADFETYASEHISRFLIGEEDVMAEWDAFQSQLQSMNLDKCMDIYQAALDRYYER